MTIQATIASMTIEEKVGQMFMLAFAGNQLDEARILMQEHLVGGAYINRRKMSPMPPSARRLCNTLQSFARGTRLGIPLLLGADQEGTWSVMDRPKQHGTGQYGAGRNR